MIRRIVIKKYVGEAIKARRKKLKMTQKELAERAGTTPHEISMIERGVRDNVRFPPEFLIEIANALDCSSLDFYPPEPEHTLSPSEEAELIKKIRNRVIESRRKRGKDL